MNRRPSLALFSAILTAALAGCVAQSNKTDTVVIKDQTKAPAPAARTPAPAPAPAPAADTVGTINLRNPNFASVNVEVRIGANSDCAANPSFGSRQLQRGATWTITANSDVCWRRDANPDAPNGTWTSWNRQSVTKGTVHEATL